jgi:hypothetical protein
MLATTPNLTITWEKLPDDFILPDDPVDNINQPCLAAALTESLVLAGKLPETALTPTNYGICATVNDKIVVKAPDWGYIPQITVPRQEVIRSYTPQLQGALPVIVIEFLSDTEGGEYSIKATYPPGKYFFYEQSLNEAGQYQLQAGDLHWISEMQLLLGVWQGMRENRHGYWLRWWDEQDNLLLWGTELTEQERQRTAQERQRAERLAAQLRAAGIEPEL